MQTATTQIYTLSLHDALPICNTLEALAELLSRHRGDRRVLLELDVKKNGGPGLRVRADVAQRVRPSEKLVERSEEHTSELQSQSNLVCRRRLEKKQS